MNCKKCNKFVYSIWQYCPNCGKKNNNIYNGCKICLVCKKRFIAQGLLNHIRGSAMVEIYKNGKGKHFDYLQRSLSKIKIQK